MSVVGGDYVHQIGILTVRCSPRPQTRFVFSTAARGFGGPVLSHDSTHVTTRAAVVRAIASLSNFTRLLDSSPAVGGAGRAVIDHYAMSFGGEAVQYSANITAVSVPTKHGCATAAEATVVEHFAGVIGTH